MNPFTIHGVERTRYLEDLSDPTPQIFLNSTLSRIGIGIENTWVNTWEVMKDYSAVLKPGECIVININQDNSFAFASVIDAGPFWFDGEKSRLALWHADTWIINSSRNLPDGYGDYLKKKKF